MPGKQILDSWKEICAYLQRSEKTCRKWERELGLPIHRMDESPSARVFAYKDELDRWRESTQHSEKKTFFRKSIVKKILIPSIAITFLLVIAVLIWWPWSDAASGPSKPSIVILPFEDLSPQKDQEYFCDGMTEEIISRLSNIEGLKVPARTSSFWFKGKGLDLPAIAERLGVENVLEGTVRQAGEKIRITVQMVNVPDGTSIWSEKFDWDQEDIFILQDEISMAIVDKLKVSLLGGDEERITKNYTKNLKAYNLYLRGRYCAHSLTREGLNTSIRFYRQALEEDPHYALAYSGLADAYCSLSYLNCMEPKQAFPKAEAAVSKALELDDMLAEAHLSLATILVHYYWDWEGAEKEYRLALDLNPNYALAHAVYAYDYLLTTGRHEEALREAKRAQELDPLSPLIIDSLGSLYRRLKQYDKAIETFQSILEIEPNYISAKANLASVYELIGDYDKSTKLSAEALKFYGVDERFLKTVQLELAKFGYKASVQKGLEIFDDYHEPGTMRYKDRAGYYAIIDKKDEAFEWLEKAYEKREGGLIHVKNSVYFENLHSDPRFESLLKRMNLDKYWTKPSNTHKK